MSSAKKSRSSGSSKRSKSKVFSAVSYSHSDAHGAPTKPALRSSPFVSSAANFRNRTAVLLLCKVRSGVS